MRRRRKKGDSFSSEVIKRFLNVLLENGKTKKTNLAANAGINYDTCIKYARFLAKVGWIEIRPYKNSDDDDVYEYLSITFEGRQKLAILSSEEDDNNITINKSINNNIIVVEDEVFSVSEIDRKIRINNVNHPPPPKIDYIPQNDKTQLLPSSSFLASTVQSHNNHHPNYGISSSDNTKEANTNLMIVDDDKDILLTYNLLLDSCGYNVRVFSDPIEALIHFVKNSSLYDLLILDIRMPRLNGIQLFQTIKSINPNMKVIFVSCLDATPELVSMLSEVRQDEILRKPVDNEHLIMTVQRALS